MYTLVQGASLPAWWADTQRRKHAPAAKRRRAEWFLAAKRLYRGSRTLLTTWMTPFDWLTSPIVTFEALPDSSMM